MFKQLLSILILVNISLIALETSENAHHNRIASDLNFVKKIFEYSYAPFEWKKELFAWNLEGEYHSIVDEVKKNKKNDSKEFQKLAVKFCSSARDYHVALLFNSTESSSLPFDVRYRNGKYILSKVEGKELPLKAGYEILTIDGNPVESIVAQLQSESRAENRAITDHGLALQILTKRNGKLGHQVPQGSVTIEVKEPDTNQVVTCQVKWDYKFERILNPFSNDTMESIELSPFGLFLKDFDRNAIIPHYEEMAEVFPDDGLPGDLIGSRKSVFSELGKERGDLVEITAEEQISRIWNWLWGLSSDAKKFFDAHLIQLPSGKYVGYVRLSTFNENDPERAFKAFLSCIKYFQYEADMLLIDQVNNPGGSLLYAYALASVLTDHPLKPLKERRLLTQSDVLKAIEFIDSWKDFSDGIEGQLVKLLGLSIQGFPLTEMLQNLLKEASYIQTQWEQGHLLTEPYPCWGMEVIKPHPKVNFTKPIFILINELDFSCADVFPALLQDNGRATLIGNSTAGAGGAITRLAFSNLIGINQLIYTHILLSRPNDKLIENIGVTPDIFFDFNNELYEKDNVSIDYSKIYNILDSMME